MHLSLLIIAIRVDIAWVTDISIVQIRKECPISRTTESVCVAADMNQRRDHDAMEPIMPSPGPMPGGVLGGYIDWRKR